MIVLLSPAKSIDVKKELQTEEFSSPVFIEEANLLIKKLRKFSQIEIKEMMNISKDLAELNYNRYKKWNTDSIKNINNSLAIAIFNGEVFKALDYLSMNSKQLIIAQDKVRVLSGLYGVLKPLDIIYPYRLEMGSKWHIDSSIKNLYQFWGSKIARCLNQENKTGVTVNLSSVEYFKAVDKKILRGRVITPIFKEFKNGEYKVVMIYAKRARGLMTRYIVDNNILNPNDIKSFNIDGYSFNTTMSNENDWVFTRKNPNLIPALKE